MIRGIFMSCFNCFRNCNRQQTTTRDFNDDSFIPSSIEVYNTASQTIASGGTVSLATANLNTGVSFTYTAGNNYVSAVTNGVYFITFTGVASSDEAEQISLAIAVNGTANTVSTVTQNLTANNSQIVTTTLILKVSSGSANISVQNSGTTSFDLASANLSVVRVGNF